MKFSQRYEKARSGSNQISGVDFRDPMQEVNNIEASTEFGVTGKEINQMRKNISRQ